MHYQGIIDTHVHYDDAAFDEDRVDIFAAFKEAGIEKVINVGASADSTAKVLSLVHAHDCVYGAVGVHPDDIGEIASDFYEEMSAALDEEKIVAVGEIGLDYHWMVQEKEAQIAAFKKQALVAIERDMPILVHSRDAAEDTLAVLTELYGAGGPGEQVTHKGVMHCYSYSPEMAERFKELGFRFGIGGVVTFKNGKKLKETVARLSLNDILLETDCPYLAPEPYRGKRNDSRYLPHVVDAIAEIKGVTAAEVVAATKENATAMFFRHLS